MSEDKKIRLCFIVFNVLLVVYTILWYLQCCFLLNNGAGASEVGNQLNQAAGVQHQITTGIGNAENTAKDLTGEISQAGSTVGRLEGEIKSSGELIADCKRILAEVRSRGAKN